MMNIASRTILLFATCLALFSAHADVRLPSVIGDHMVLQQNTTVQLWGWSDPGEKVTVKADWDTATYSAVGSSAATWSVQLRTPAAGGPFHIRVKGNNSIDVSDVMVGEVWVCSGQSNMEMNVGWGLKYDEDVANANNQRIRFFYIPKTTAPFPQEDVRAHWVVCTPEEMKRFSAAGYFFGRKINEQLNVPVGLINANWGGTPAEVWTPANLVDSDAVLKQAAGQLKPSNGWPILPGLTYNAMIYPITRYPIAGAIWYQGESNVGTASTYQQLFSTMINSWRKAWHKDFPFYYVQIAPFAGYGNSSSSAFLREAQTKTLSVPNTGMVVVTDLVDNINDIHPKLKKEVGERLANLALAKTYNQSGMAYEYPTVSGVKFEKKRARVYFNNAESGLIARNGAPTEFYIAGADKKFYPANAKIEKNSVVVWSKEVPQPVAVRFGFHNTSQPNLFSKEGLPANSFRTDDWPVDVIKAEAAQGPVTKK